MPLFFFLSGLLFHDSSNFIVKRTKQLIIPFFVFSIISFPIKYIERCILQGAIYFNLSYLSLQFHNIPLWFCISLFSISCIFHLLVRYCRNLLFLYVSLIFISLSGIVFSYFKIFLPLYLSQTFLAFPFYAIGYYSSSIKTNWRGMVVSSIILFFAHISDVNTNISGLIVNQNPLLYLLPALSGIYIIIYLSVLIEDYNPNNYFKENLLNFLGRNSLYIFALHWPFITILQKTNETIGINKQIGTILIFFVIIIIPLSLGQSLHNLFPKYFRPICLKE